MSIANNARNFQKCKVVIDTASANNEQSTGIVPDLP